MNIEVARQLTHARTALVIDFPFFGQLALRLNMVERNDIKTLAVDGKSIFYNADFVAALPPARRKSALGHEVLHCVFDHIGRRGARKPRKWNMAGDYVINPVLKDSGLEIGENWLFNPAFAGMSADEVYNLLPDDDDDDDGDGKEPLDEIMDGSPDTREVDAMDWKVATVQAANTARAMGKLPGSLERFVDSLVNPQVDWREQLRRFMLPSLGGDYTWMRPNRMFINQGIYLPTLYSETVGEIVVCIDTSGSITNEVLNAFGSEIKAIVDQARPSKTHVIYCDAAVNHVDCFTPDDDLQFKMHGGGGGTDFRPPFAYVEEHQIAPKCLVYLTDMYGSFPASAPDYDVMWISTSGVVGPFGETLPIEV